MSKSPCKDCERKGCGSYHDECKVYQEYVKNHSDSKEYNKRMKEVTKRWQK